MLTLYRPEGLNANTFFVCASEQQATHFDTAMRNAPVPFVDYKINFMEGSKRVRDFSGSAGNCPKRVVGIRSGRGRHVRRESAVNPVSNETVPVSSDSPESACKE